MRAEDIISSFMSLVRDSGPVFVLGVILSAGVQRWFRLSWAERWLAQPRGSVWMAALAGSLLPGCAVTTVPLANAFRNRGANVGSLTTFIMIAPILSPHTVILNAVMLGPAMTAGRIILPFLLSVALGLALNAMNVKRPSEENSGKDSSALGDACSCATEQFPYSRIAWHLARDLLPYFALGLLAVAVLQTILPPDLLTKHMQRGWMAYAAAAAAGIPLYVCEGAEVPLTLALLKLGVGIGPAFTFLLSSVGTCIPTIAMAPRVIGRRPTIIYVLCWLVLAVGGGVVMELMF
jgi:uncharacterized membrane protein YraQ (UPF0718 family)